MLSGWYKKQKLDTYIYITHIGEASSPLKSDYHSPGHWCSPITTMPDFNMPDARGQCKLGPLSPTWIILILAASAVFPGITLTVNGVMLETEQQQIQGE